MTVSAELVKWHGRPPPGRRRSVKRVFSEKIKRINAKFCGKVATTISSYDIFVFKIFEFLI